ncbi:MAG: hypothetical protein AB8G86_19065 [Saprospiraceae bacterium]
MTDIWQYFQNLFLKVEHSSKNQPILHDSIERSVEELAAYEQWKGLMVKKQLMNWLETEYVDFLKDGQPIDKNIIFLDTVSSKGFAIRFSELRYNTTQANQLFDYLKEKIMLLNYKTYAADIKTYTKGKIIESLAKYYLKPSLKNMLSGPPFNQEFGNINIELICQNDLPTLLKFSATVYNDRSYLPPKRFGALMEHLLN